MYRRRSKPVGDKFNQFCTTSLVGQSLPRNILDLPLGAVPFQELFTCLQWLHLQSDLICCLQVYRDGADMTWTCTVQGLIVLLVFCELFLQHMIELLPGDVFPYPFSFSSCWPALLCKTNVPRSFSRFISCQDCPVVTILPVEMPLFFFSIIITAMHQQCISMLFLKLGTWFTLLHSARLTCIPSKQILTDIYVIALCSWPWTLQPNSLIAILTCHENLVATTKSCL